MKADFIANENVDRFLDMLRRPHLTDDKRTTLQKLLVQQEDGSQEAASTLSFPSAVSRTAKNASEN